VESALTKACTIKIQNFEGPFDLLFHLIEKNKVNIYDIPINEITDQYMDYLFAMQTMDLEVASEFLVMASTLLHIKSRMLLPEKKEKTEDEIDPREELVIRLIQYKKYKEFTQVLKEREIEWAKVFYKLPEVIEIKRQDEILDLRPEELRRVYFELIARNRGKMNRAAAKITQIIQHEKVTLKSKITEVVKKLLSKSFFVFSELFSTKTRSKTEVVTGFLAILELTKLKKIRLVQEKQFGELIVHRSTDNFDYNEDEVSVDA
jgi:segregation and condensation protein A